ncbi:uncharacterized protein BXZ73DRAFT_109105, partial [Epithele typhae]|uniref:uncharacterized protein n=1 Tax=Epithele typhae TaxID=378194 RepID=UPI002008B4D1
MSPSSKKGKKKASPPADDMAWETERDYQRVLQQALTASSTILAGGNPDGAWTDSEDELFTARPSPRRKSRTPASAPAPAPAPPPPAAPAAPTVRELLLHLFGVALRLGPINESNFAEASVLFNKAPGQSSDALAQFWAQNTTQCVLAMDYANITAHYRDQVARAANPPPPPAETDAMDVAPADLPPTAPLPAPPLQAAPPASPPPAPILEAAPVASP